MARNDFMLIRSFFIKAHVLLSTTVIVTYLAPTVLQTYENIRS